MPITLPLEPVGPVIRLAVGLSMNQAQKVLLSSRPIPAAIEVRAVIDTASKNCFLDRTIISQLGLEKIGEAEIVSPATGKDGKLCAQFEIGARILHPGLELPIAALRVLEADLLVQGFHAILGRDFLRYCIFVYDGPAGKFTLGF